MTQMESTMTRPMKLTASDIHLTINLHIRAYENIGEKPPPFRMTIQENDILEKDCRKKFNMPAREEYNYIKQYMGVDIIIVAEVKLA